MLTSRRLCVLTIPATLLLLANVARADESVPTDHRPRLIILTDIGGDPDDTQSLIRLLVFANEFEIEGLIASASGTPGELKRVIVQPQLIRNVVEAYGQVRDNLAKHAKDFPTKDELLSRIKSGNPKRGVESIGEGHDTEGSNWIIKVVDRDDPRPVNIAIWGGSTELAQALWRVRNDRDETAARKFIDKLRVHAIAHQDDTGPWVLKQFPDLFYVLNMVEPGNDKRESVFRGMYLGGDESLTSLDWLDTHVRKNHGPLGALYPTRTWTAPNPHKALKEGDTPSWFFFLRNGLHDASRPDYGGWGGRFTHAKGGLWRDAKDTVGDKTHARATVWRWRPHYQNAFAARMDFCVKPPDEANHAPIVMVNGKRVRDPIVKRLKPGESIRLDVSDSIDVDDDGLSFNWWQYREAGTFDGAVKLETAANLPAVVAVTPVKADGKTIHLIAEVTDNGEPPLTSYARFVLDVSAKEKPKATKIPDEAKEFKGHRYLVVKKKVSWQEAKKLCEEMGGQLACIETKQEQAFIAKLAAGKYYYLGATDEKKEGEFEWINVSPFKFTAWYEGQPNNYDGNEHYLATYKEGEWVDVAAEGKGFWMPIGFICEWER